MQTKKVSPAFLASHCSSTSSFPCNMKKKTMNNKFKELNQILDSENINLSNIINDKKILQKAILKTKETQTNEKTTQSQSQQNSEIAKIDYNFIFQKICDYFLAIYNPEQILFRETEVREISEFLEGCFTFKSKQRSLLISGKPGCGKTLTVTKTIENNINGKNQIKFIKLNAMAFKNPLDFIEEIKLQVSHKKQLVKKSSTFEKQSLSQVLKEQKTYDNIVIMIDEIDNLFMKNSSNLQEIIEIFKVSNDPECRFVLVGVSNSMELIYKIGKKYNKNLEDTKNVVFTSYSFDEMIKIIQERIDNFMIQNGLSSRIDSKEILEENALRLCATRIYNLKGGDIRCILEVLMKSFLRQCEKIKNLKTFENVAISLSDLLKIFDELYNQRKINDIIDSFPVIHQTVLLVLYLHFSKTPENNEVDLNKLLLMFNNLVDDLFMQKQDAKSFLELLKCLESYNFIIIKQNSKLKMNMESKIIKIEIKLNEIKNTLIEKEVFKNYFSI